MLLSILLNYLFTINYAYGTIRERASSHSTKYNKCDYLDGIYTSVMRSIYNPGFHKDLSTEIEIMLTTTLLPAKCRLVIEETFPRGMYVDPDQLRDLRELNGLKTYTAAKIDIEKPEFEAESFRLYIFKDLEIQENLRVTRVDIPIHLRYQLPRGQNSQEQKRGEQPLSIVRLQNPRLLLSCDDENIANHCPDRLVTTYCNSLGNTKCEYMVLPYKANVNSVEVSVPTGNSDHAPSVVGLTTLVISGATIYLLVSLFRKNTNNTNQ